jgi:hypothetical protein
VCRASSFCWKSQECSVNKMAPYPWDYMDYKLNIGPNPCYIIFCHGLRSKDPLFCWGRRSLKNAFLFSKQLRVNIALSVGCSLISKSKQSLTWTCNMSISLITSARKLFAWNQISICPNELQSVLQNRKVSLRIYNLTFFLFFSQIKTSDLWPFLILPILGGIWHYSVRIMGGICSLKSYSGKVHSPQLRPI